MKRNLRRVIQPNDYTCGPAALSSLFSFWDEDVSIEEISKAVNKFDFNILYGFRPDMLAFAVEQLRSDYRLWLKINSDMSEVAHILSNGFPVGVVWQGIFSQDAIIEEPKESCDDGHYGIITEVDEDLGFVKIIDPSECLEDDFEVPVCVFERRWFDFTYVFSEGGKKRVDADRMVLLLVPAENRFPNEVGMVYASSFGN